MIELKPFGQGLGIIALQLNKPVTGELIRAYWVAFQGETEPHEWAAFCATAATRCGWEFLPTAPRLLEALREFRGQPALLPEAVATYERAMAAGEYTPEGGTTWTYRRVAETCGRAAAEAFLAAGGNSAFVTTWNEAKRREAFLDAYQLAARQDPTTRALPAPEQKAITGEVESGPVEAGSAAVAMREIRERLGVREMPKAPAEETRVVLTDERLTALRRQAEEITSEPVSAGD